ncbi:hypothetical protein [Nocardia sp. NPDC051832]|uniref:hypothetical protein n=1 Tax=Nocardia sp. NPDC051832 TaxID=3155673 RepID=UPI00341C099C
MRVNWPTYYEAAKKCHDLATALRTADKPVHDAMKNDCVGMAGDAPGCREWGQAFDRAALTTAQTCTNLADALTNFGYVLYAAGYNLGVSDVGKTSTQPPRPDVRPVSLYKVDFPSSVGDNGNGIERDDSVGVEAVFDEVAGQVAKVFGKLPNGNTSKLSKAESVWTAFAREETVTGAASQIKTILGLFDGADDPSSSEYQKSLESIRGHLGTLQTGATQLAAASLTMANPIKEYNSSTTEVRVDFGNAIKSALIAITTALAVTAVTAWFTFGASVAVGGASVAVIGGNTIRAIQLAYDASKLYKALGWTTAAAAAYVGTMAAFNGVPDLNSASAALAGIISLVPTLDGADEDINSSNPSGAFTSPSMTTKVPRIASHYGVPAQEVREAIHRIKNAAAFRGNGAMRNPDVVVDLESGEVYPKNSDGSVSEDSIGNILDELGE